MKFYLGVLFCSLLFVSTAFAIDVKSVLETNLGDHYGKTTMSNETCGVSIQQMTGGDFQFVYYPGWSNGAMGQVVYYSQSEKWALLADILKVRLFTNQNGQGVVTLKMDSSGKFISGQLDSENQSCAL